MKLSERERSLLIANVIRDVERFHADMGPDAGPLSGYCLLYAGFTAEHLRKAGLSAGIFAGTAYWKRCRPEDDTGPPFCPDFGYDFTWNAQTMMALGNGTLPEMHCWAVIYDDDYPKCELIDMTTRYLPERASFFGFEWTAARPPETLWCDTASLPADSHYNAHAIACQIARHYWKVMRHGYEGPLMLTAHARPAIAR